MSPRLRKKPRPAWTMALLDFIPACGGGSAAEAGHEEPEPAKQEKVEAIAPTEVEESESDEQDEQSLVNTDEHPLVKAAEATATRKRLTCKKPASEDKKCGYFYGFDTELQTCWRCTAENPMKELAVDLIWPADREAGEPAQALFADGTQHDIPDVWCSDIEAIKGGRRTGLAGCGYFEAEHSVTMNV